MGIPVLIHLTVLISAATVVYSQAYGRRTTPPTPAPCPYDYGPCHPITYQCPPGSSCRNGRCCGSAPKCPGNKPSYGSCWGTGACGTGYNCVNGLCCEVPTCPGEKKSYGSCWGTSACGTGYVCINDACCPGVTCDFGNPVGTCTTDDQCWSGYTCKHPYAGHVGHGKCCKIPPVCSNGQQHTNLCQASNQCGPAETCELLSQNYYACCPNVPTCPGGKTSHGSCWGDSVCTKGFDCINYACCPGVTCDFGNPVGTCTTDDQCWSGYTCKYPAGHVGQGKCCKIPPVVTCDFGNPVGTCTTDDQCWSGYTCKYPTGHVGHGKCCKIPPVCSNGQQHNNLCQASNQCSPTETCEQLAENYYACCPNDQCPTYVPCSQHSRSCYQSTDCPRGGTCCSSACGKVCTYPNAGYK